jgi:hypothetical protein
MNDVYYKTLNAELGAEFDLFAMEQPDWMAANVPEEAIVVLQTDDPGFNAWAKEIAERNRNLEQPPRPIVLVHIRELRPAHSRILRVEAEMLTG